jgi:autotransporter-associated beta strand protein
VVFTGNTSGAVIKDWAYDNSGSAIVVDRVTQSAPSAGTQTVTLSPGSGESFTLGSQITNTGGNVNSVVKTGAGSTTLTGINNYTGSTTVDQGLLVVNGNISTSSLTTVNTGAAVGGGGTTGNLLVSTGGTLAPGTGIGTLSINGNLQLDSGSVTEFEISTGNQSDLALVAAQLAFGGTLHVTNIGGTLAEGDTFNLFDWGTRTGTFSEVLLPTLTSGLAWDQSQLYSTGTLTVVPEPGAALLGSVGMLMLFRRRREPKKAANFSPRS